MLHFLPSSRTSVMLNESSVPVVRWRRRVRSSLHTVMSRNSTGVQMFYHQSGCAVESVNENGKGDGEHEARTKAKSLAD